MHVCVCIDYVCMYIHTWSGKVHMLCCCAHASTPHVHAHYMLTYMYSHTTHACVYKCSYIQYVHKLVVLGLGSRESECDRSHQCLYENYLVST